MWRTSTPVALVVWAAVFLGIPADGQTTRRTPAAQGTAGNAATSIGAGIADRMQSFSAGVPALQQAQQLRDTALRGEFVGAEAQTMPQIFASPEMTHTPQRGGRLNVRLDPVRQPRAQAARGQPHGRQVGSVLQPTLSLGFSAPTVPTVEVQSNVTAAVMRVPSIRENSSIEVRVEGGVVVLEGTVSDPHHRALAAQLVALEPGVSKVDNRLTVSPPAR